MDAEKAKTQTITSAFFLSLQPVSAMIIGILIIHAISKNIASEDLGIFSFLTMLYNWYATFFLLMIHGAITRYAGEYIGRGDKQIVRSIVKTSTLYMLIVIPMTMFIVFYFNKVIFDILNIEITFSTLLIFCLATGSSIGALLLTSLGRGLQKLRKVGTIAFLATIVSQTITWILINAGFGISSLVIRWLLGNVIIIFLLVISDKSLVSLKGDFFPFRKLVTFSLPIFIESMVAYIGQRYLLRVVLKNSFSLSVVGYFEFGMRISLLVSTLALGYLSALTPYFVTDYGYGGEHRVSKNLGWTVKFGSFAFSPLIIGSVAAGKIIFDIAFKEYLPAYFFFAILTFGLWPVLLLRPFSYILVALERPKKLLKARIIATLCGIPLTFLFINVGALGITIVWVFMETIWSCLNFFFCRKFIEINVDWKKTLMFLIAAFVTFPVVLIENYFLQDYFALFVAILTILIIYIVLVRVLGLIKEQEVLTALAFLPEILRKKIARLLSKTSSQKPIT